MRTWMQCSRQLRVEKRNVPLSLTWIKEFPAIAC